LKQHLVQKLRESGHEVIDFGDLQSAPNDDYPGFVIPLARAVACREVDRGVALCGSGVGACVAANKVEGVRACLIHETFSAHQGVEDDDLNIICLGGIVVVMRWPGNWSRPSWPLASVAQNGIAGDWRKLRRLRASHGHRRHELKSLFPRVGQSRIPAPMRVDHPVSPRGSHLSFNDDT